MALQKQVITLDFGFGGIDQRTDQRYLQKVKFADLSNVRFNKIGRIDPRPGSYSFASLSQTVDKLIARQDGLVAICSSHTLLPDTSYKIMSDGSSDPSSSDLVVAPAPVAAAQPFTPSALDCHWYVIAPDPPLTTTVI